MRSSGRASGSNSPEERTVALYANASNHYECRWVTVGSLPNRCVFVPEGLRMERLGRTTVIPAAQVLNLTDDGVGDVADLTPTAANSAGTYTYSTIETSGNIKATDTASGDFEEVSWEAALKEIGDDFDGEVIGSRPKSTAHDDDVGFVQRGGGLPIIMGERVVHCFDALEVLIVHGNDGGR